MSNGHGQRTLRRELRVAFGVVLVLLVLVGAVGAVAVHTTANDTRRATEEITPALQANADVLQAVADIDAALRGYVITANSSYLGPYRRGLTRLRVTRSQLRDVLGELSGARAGQSQERAIDRWLRQYALPRVEQPVGADNINEQLLRQNLRLQGEIRSANESVRSSLRTRLERLSARSEQTRTWVTAGVALLALLALGAGAATSVRTTRRVRRPLAELRDVLGDLAGGDHEARVRPAGPREIAKIGERVNELADETDRLRAVEAEERRLQERLVEFSRAVRATQDERDIMAMGVTELGTALRPRRAYLRMLEHGAAAGIGAEWHAAGLAPLPEAIRRATPGSEDELNKLLRGVDARVTPDVSTDPVYASREGSAWARAAGAGATMAVPLRVGDRPVAVVSLIDAVPRDWTPAEVHLAESVAADMGRALADARLYADQMEALNRLSALDKAKDDFVSGVSHELRTPLTSIGGYLELLEDDLSDSSTRTRRHAVGVLRRNVDRLGGLIEDLLALSRIESGAFHTVHDDVDVVGVVRHVLDDMRPQADGKELDLRARLVDRAVVRGDEAQLGRAMLNLVSNAIKFTPSGGVVEVTVDTDGPQVSIRVADDGIGIPARDQEQLFQRFFRASNAVRSEVPGTGLGLAIVRTIIENHDGTLGVDSVEGKGTTVVVRLPGAASAARPPGTSRG